MNLKKSIPNGVDKINDYLLNVDAVIDKNKLLTAQITDIAV